MPCPTPPCSVSLLFLSVAIERIGGGGGEEQLHISSHGWVGKLWGFPSLASSVLSKFYSPLEPCGEWKVGAGGGGKGRWQAGWVMELEGVIHTETLGQNALSQKHLNERSAFRTQQHVVLFPRSAVGLRREGLAEPVRLQGGRRMVTRSSILLEQ